jgi:hypothetical protein
MEDPRCPTCAHAGYRSSMTSSFADLLQAWSRDRALTQAKWNGPVLLQRTTASTPDGEDWAQTSAAVVMSRPQAKDSRVHLIAKAGKANAFPMGVTVGRIESNDIALDDPSVSRFHAWLQQDERTKQWALTDAESKNVTWVAGVELTARQRVPLTDCTEIRLGNVYLTFLSPESLWALLNSPR